MSISSTPGCLLADEIDSGAVVLVRCWFQQENAYLDQEACKLAAKALRSMESETANTLTEPEGYPAFTIHKGLCISPPECRAEKKCLGPCEGISFDKFERRFPICKDHTDSDWNQPALDDDGCVLCRLFYLEAQESLLEEWQQRAERAEEALAEVQRPLDAQMARLNATVVQLNEENERLRLTQSATLSSKPPCGWGAWGKLVNDWFAEHGDIAHMRGADLWDRIVKMVNGSDSSRKVDR